MNSQIGISANHLSPDYLKCKGYKRIQICQETMRSSGITDIIKFSRANDIKLGYHLPIYHQSNPKDTYYLSKNFRLRDANFEILESNIRMIRCLDVDYIVIHFFSEKMKDEHYHSDEEFREIAITSLRRINMLAEEYDVKINIEYSSIYSKMNSPKEWVDMIKNHDRLGICLDIGELHFRSLETGSDFYRELDYLLDHSDIVNLYNARSREDIEEFGFIPPNSEQNSKEGWIDIIDLVYMIKKKGIKSPIIFDPNFDYKGEDYFTEGIEWVDDMLNSFD